MQARYLRRDARVALELSAFTQGRRRLSERQAEKERDAIDLAETETRVRARWGIVRAAWLGVAPATARHARLFLHGVRAGGVRAAALPSGGRLRTECGNGRGEELGPSLLDPDSVLPVHCAQYPSTLYPTPRYFFRNIRVSGNGIINYQDFGQRGRVG